MLHVHQLIARLPPRAQRLALNLAMRAGIPRHLAVFRMLTRFFVSAGADPVELHDALARCQDFGPSFVLVFRTLSIQVAERARQTGNPKDHYRAALYAVLGDWMSTDLSERRKNYALAIPEFEAFARQRAYPTERVKIHYRDTGLYGYSVRPPPGSTPRAGVLLVPGNDEAKEMMIPMADAAAEHGLLALVVDLPGYGENFLSGTRLSGPDALRDYGQGALEFFAANGVSRVGTFGVSLGGLLAHGVAALVPEFGASAGLGGPFDLLWLFGHAPDPMVQRFRLASDAKTANDIAAMVQAHDIAGTLRRVRRPALVVHGTEDEVVPVRDARSIAAAIGPSAELRLLPGLDHMAGGQLDSETAFVMAWLLERLEKS